MIAILVACLALVLATTATTTAFASESTSSEEADVYTLVFDEDGNLVAVPEARAGQYTTFVTFETGIYSVQQGYDFTLGHSCKLKMMWVGQYTDGSSGTMTATLVGPSTWQEHDFAMDGKARTIEFDGNWLTGTLPAGQYSILLMPDAFKSYASVGSVYSLSY